MKSRTLNRASKWVRIQAVIKPWWLLMVGAVGGAAVVSGAFDPGFQPWWISVVVGLMVAGLISWDARRRMLSNPAPRTFGEIEGPILWVVATWMLMRLGGVYAPHLTPFGAALLAWLVATFPRRVHGVAIAAALVLEVGLTTAGRQSIWALLLHALVFGGVAFALSRLTQGEVFRRTLNEAHAKQRAEAEEHSRAHDFGLLTAQAPALRELPNIDGWAGRPTVGRQTLDYLAQSFTLQLDLLREALDLTTAVVLWRKPAKGELHLRGWSSTRDDLCPGPFLEGAGIPGSVLRDVREVGIAPVHNGFGGLPYYENAAGVGGAMAIAIPAPSDVLVGGQGRPAGVLCVDRVANTRWTDAERKVLRIAARKLAFDVATSQQLKATDYERSTISRFCAGLEGMNRALEVEQVAEAAIAAVRALVAADLAVISVQNGPIHRVLRAEGRHAEQLRGLEFTGEDGLVGQALRVGQVLPVGGEYRGNHAIFTAGDKLDDMSSLLVVPLSTPAGDRIGALTVAAEAEGAFGSPRKEMLELVAGQVGIKLDLARAHDQIREMAITDGLTGLTNHRTFQQAFDTMLNRAERQSTPLVFILADIDHFKRLNDTYGHQFGDEVLKAVAQVLNNAVRKVDCAARYGGEEFGLILEDSNLEGGQQLAERIRSGVEALSFVHEKGPVSVTLSLGVAAFPIDGIHKIQLIERADQALYQAKRGGRNQTVSWVDLPADVRLSAEAS